MSDKALDTFGKMLMQGVRDRVLRHWQMVIEGKMEDTESRRIFEEIHRKSGADAVSELAPKIIDTTLHYLLCMLEDEQSLSLSVDAGDAVTKNIRDVSDGLA